MAKKVTEVRVVIASPSDVTNLREIVFEVIRDLNRAYEPQSLSIRALGWEEYGTPGIDTEAQGVLNEQLLSEYDMLIAIFGTSLGTPTKTAASGTVEEIEHAISKEDSEFGKFRVQTYFQDRIDSIRKISISKLGKVVEYKESLAAKGVLYREFSDQTEFEKEVRINLQRAISYFQNPKSQAPILSAERAVAPETITHDDRSKTIPGFHDRKVASELPDHTHSLAIDEIEEPGFLDVQADAEISLSDLTASLGRMTSLIDEIGVETNKQVELVERSLSPNAPAAEKKEVINKFANFLKEKAVDLQAEANIARAQIATYESSGMRIILFARETQLDGQYKEQLANFLAVGETLLQTVGLSRNSINEFKDSVKNIPRITIQFNQAKKMLLSALEICVRMCDEMEKAILAIASRG